MMAGVWLFILVSFGFHAGQAAKDLPGHVGSNHTCVHRLKKGEIIKYDLNSAEYVTLLFK